MFRVMVSTGSMLCVLIVMGASATSAPLTPGNLRICTDDVLHEYTVDGTFVQSFPVPYPAGARPITEAAREIETNTAGQVHVYNGTFDPYVSTLDPATGTWTHLTHPGFSTANVGGYGSGVRSTRRRGRGTSRRHHAIARRVVVRSARVLRTRRNPRTSRV